MYSLLNVTVCYILAQRQGESHIFCLLAPVAFFQVELSRRKRECTSFENRWTCSAERNFWSFLSQGLVSLGGDFREGNSSVDPKGVYYKVIASQKKPHWEILAWEQACRKGRVGDEQGRDWLTHWFLVSFIQQDNFSSL